MPFDLFKAVEHASTILHWQENLSSDEMPPEWMWSVESELAVWFERVQDERDERYGITRDRDDSSGNGSGSMMRNELAKGMRRG